jgi:GNAT superfamily N-acetyltransferase
MGLPGAFADRHRAGVSTAMVVDTVVTYLSMAEPPPTFPVRPDGIRIDLLKAENIPLQYYRYLYNAVGAEWLWFERHIIDDAALAGMLHRDGVEVYVLHANGCPAGYYELDFGALPEVNLVYFGLVSEWSGKRLGPWLLGSAVAEAFSRGARELTVNTCTLDHPAALPLYRRLGFRPVGEEKRRLAVPPEIPIPRHINARQAP